MGDESTVLTAADARHLLRRTGFGAPAKDVQKILQRGDTRGSAADRLLGFKPGAFQPAGKDLRLRQNSWLKYMIGTKSPLQEKLVLFWHDHFSTAASKVGDVKQLATQNRLLRQNCKGNFRTLLREINRDPAMMEFLDTVRNRKYVPNENYGRELCELFALGVKDANGNPNYVQDDVVQLARAFTGWRIDRDKSYFDERNHDFEEDYPERGPKVVFTQTGGFGAVGRSFTTAGEGAQEIDTVVDILLAHRDSDGRSTVARRIARRLLEFFAHGAFAESTPETTAVVDAVIAASGFDSSWELQPLLRAILVSDAFYATAAAAPYGATTAKSVKWPVDFVVTTMRTVGLKPKGRETYVDGGSRRSLRSHLAAMGQQLFDPPSVFGWEWERSWITSATTLARARFARDVIMARGTGGTSFRPEKLIDLSLTAPDAILDAVTDALGISDQVTTQQRTILIDYLTDAGTRPSLDLEDEDTRNRKLHGLFGLLLQSPAYQLH
ncbi:DUF1800 domain-containing protein [Candidatus Binatia bacterium]|nr:DUF1800 domain-containing protein [Candidatus Binatia bacterium]